MSTIITTKVNPGFQFKYVHWKWAILWSIVGIALIFQFRVWSIPVRAALSLGLIGMWRYGLQVLHLVRSLIYSKIKFPKIRAKASATKIEQFKQFFIIVADYKIEEEVRAIAFQQLERAIQQVAEDIEVHLIYTSDNAAEVICKKSDFYTFHQLRQCNGKRCALADALDFAKKQSHNINESIVVLMDGDTAVDTDTFKKSIPIFEIKPELGALTTNERVKLIGQNSWILSWYKLKFAKRDHHMKSQALSDRVLTLTGRLSMYSGSVSLTEDFIQSLRNDIVKHWIHGDIKLLMGDDKTTCYKVMFSGKPMLYLPDTYVTTYESVSKPFVQTSLGLMARWYGNSLRNTPRIVNKGWPHLPFFIWYCCLDVLICYWTTLIGPIVGLLLLLVFGFNALFGYLGFVFLTRAFQLSILGIHGHKLNPRDIVLTIYDQWVGSVIKIFNTFYPNKQTFALRHTHKDKNLSLFKSELNYMMMVLTLAFEAFIISWLII